MDERHQVVVGVLADEGLPEQVVTSLADELPEVLAAQVGGQARWRVEHVVDQLPLDDDGEIPMRELSRRHRRDRGWDLLVLVTDLPRRSGTSPVAAGVDVDHGVAVISLPALGAVLVRRRARALLVRVVRHLLSRRSGAEGDPGDQGGVTRLSEALAPTKPLSDDDGSAQTHVALVGLRGRLRLLAGMVRDNRPGRLVPHLAGATAAAAGTAAYGVITSSFWKLADALSPLRLAVISVVAILVMTAWLVVYNRLRDRPRDAAERRKAVLYNISTATTLAIGVACMYAILFVLSLLGAAVLINSDYFAQTLGHPVGAGSYLNLVWLCTSVGIVAGALGSSLEDEETIRNATYGRRERERQERNRRERGHRESADR
ncbi:hypothetical protein [Actinokineospora bangkokensis]|uniref:DUF2267 domain-containing protein n=1 Tax=Actinokineospora bangkokensis TaxID=1193682 RepID=A0A1Q9LRU4_9PSEU|nr:hypothetical protein [Actinokineospora bangkokensis]OLR94742.1 hypothetical protein BJP25_11615 [Actinokineospora bangkokensis]